MTSRYDFGRDSDCQSISYLLWIFDRRHIALHNIVLNWYEIMTYVSRIIRSSQKWDLEYIWRGKSEINTSISYRSDEKSRYYRIYRDDEIRAGVVRRVWPLRRIVRNLVDRDLSGAISSRYYRNASNTKTIMTTSSSSTIWEVTRYILYD